MSFSRLPFADLRLMMREGLDQEAEWGGGDMDGVAVADAAFEDLLRQRGLELSRDDPFERPGAVDRVVALIGQPGLRRWVDLERDLALGQQSLQMSQLDLDDALHVLARDAPEQEDL